MCTSCIYEEVETSASHSPWNEHATCIGDCLGLRFLRQAIGGGWDQQMRSADYPSLTVHPASELVPTSPVASHFHKSWLELLVKPSWLS